MQELPKHPNASSYETILRVSQNPAGIGSMCGLLTYQIPRVATKNNSSLPFTENILPDTTTDTVGANYHIRLDYGALIECDGIALD